MKSFLQFFFTRISRPLLIIGAMFIIGRSLNFLFTIIRFYKESFQSLTSIILFVISMVILISLIVLFLRAKIFESVKTEIIDGGLFDDETNSIVISALNLCEEEFQPSSELKEQEKDLTNNINSKGYKALFTTYIESYKKELNHHSNKKGSLIIKKRHLIYKTLKEKYFDLYRKKYSFLGKNICKILAHLKADEISDWYEEKLIHRLLPHKKLNHKTMRHIHLYGSINYPGLPFLNKYSIIEAIYFFLFFISNSIAYVFSGMNSANIFVVSNKIERIFYWVVGILFFIDICGLIEPLIGMDLFVLIGVFFIILSDLIKAIIAIILSIIS